MWEFPIIRVPYFGVLIIRILLFRVLYQGPCRAMLRPELWEKAPKAKNLQHREEKQQEPAQRLQYPLIQEYTLN